MLNNDKSNSTVPSSSSSRPAATNRNDGAAFTSSGAGSGAGSSSGSGNVENAAGRSQKEQGPQQQQQPAVLKDGEGRRPTILLSSDDVANKPKKPRDTRLHECFIVTPVMKDDTDQQGGGGGVKIVCKYCHDYVKVLQKFNPTKAREHLTARCTGVDEALKIALLDSTQSAVKKRSTVNINAAAAPADQLRVVPSSSSLASTTMDKVCRPPSSAILSFYPDNNVVAEFLEVTASLQNGDLILTLTFFPADKEKTNQQQQLKLNFIADQNSEGAALCIDGFMNMHHEASWTAFLYVMAKDGTTRVGPYCQWSLNYGEFDMDISRAQKVEQLLKIMANH